MGKKLIAVIMAILGSVVAYMLALDISSIDWGSISFWSPFIVGVIAAFSAQYVIYSAMWKGTGAEVRLANVTPLNSDPYVFEKAAWRSRASRMRAMQGDPPESSCEGTPGGT